ncbi:hypothetical protein ACHAXA_003429 [Cyclostephanos tholiformis]|uniref:Uncharacterized protein n=1 Tax=Cyclostephanos tholiformis TaxID=382380 RepID=A0ABD3SFD9_9STRA
MKSKAKNMNEQARRYFNELANELNLKCPRCQTAFLDYEGCNALKCGVSGCQAAFCAICLKDCGSDAHPHVIETHEGDLFDKTAFNKSVKNRVKMKFDILMDKLTRTDEPMELRQLVLNHVEKANLLQDKPVFSDASVKVAEFLEKTKANLTRAVRSDRLALLSDPEEYGRRAISRDSISPRCVVPRDYRLSLTRVQDDLFRISLEHNIIPGEDFWSRIDDIESHFKENPKVESLQNLSQSIRCAVIAFDGKAELYQSSRGDSSKRRQDDGDGICIRLQVIDHRGNVKEDMEYHNRYETMNIIGLNQNLRMLSLEKHIQVTPETELMFEPLKHLIGSGVPQPVIMEMEFDTPESYFDLNEEQRKVAHPLHLKTAMEVAGPPGTGKTKTIVELVQALLKCTSYDILLLSERNGAINAIAEKFEKDSMTMKGKKIEIIDLHTWQSVVAYGAGDAMGDSTKLFTVTKKLESHPELVELKERRDLLIAASEKLSQALRSKIAEFMRGFGHHFNEDAAANRSDLIEEKKVELGSSPQSIIDAVERASLDIKELLQNKGSKYVSEENATNVIDRHADLLGRLVHIRPDNKKSVPWDAKEATKRLCYIQDMFSDVLKLPIFSPDNAQILYSERAASDEEYKAVHRRLESELPTLARLHMSTIGSSHRIHIAKENNVDFNLAHTFGTLTLNDVDDDCGQEPPKETICIFDESGCIPAYELLGLTRLGRSIKALILVGDKHQLPPYDPTQGRSFGRRSSFGHAAGNGKSKKDDKIQSLLDVSLLTVDSGKIMLTSQYRVPRDIAEMLNSRIYRGNYVTCPQARVPNSGLKMVHVPWAESPKRKYVNPNEVNEGIQLVNKLSVAHDISSVLLITPYKNQQREFEFQLKRQTRAMKITVLTIDQCQGQEADAVILSLVRRPTRFLTLNRLNVALSRAKKNLYVLTDFKDLQQACRDTHWESAHLAADLLIGLI